MRETVRGPVWGFPGVRGAFGGPGRGFHCGGAPPEGSDGERPEGIAPSEASGEADYFSFRVLMAACTSSFSGVTLPSLEFWIFTQMKSFFTSGLAA